MKLGKKSKAIITVLLAAVLLCSLPASVLAVSNDAPTVSPRWVSIYTIDLDMAFVDGEGTAVGTARKKSTATFIEGSLFMYKLVDGEWVFIYAWYGNKAVGTLSVSGYFACESGVTYKAIFEVTAYTNSESERETVEYIETCP